MQELIEHIQVNATKFSLMNTYNILKEIEPYLEKEKKQIEKTWFDSTAQFDNAAGMTYEKSFEEYYNEKYQNK